MVNIYAVSGDDGKLLSGFPISVGGNIPRLNTIVKRENDLLLSVTSSNNDVYFLEYQFNWRCSIGEVNMVIILTLHQLDLQIMKILFQHSFPKNKTYNWPNPVYGR